MSNFMLLPDFIRPSMMLIRENYRTSKRIKALKRISRRPQREIIVGADSTNYVGLEKLLQFLHRLMQRNPINL